MPALQSELRVAAGGRPSYFESLELPIPLKCVRLVCNIQDPLTGTFTPTIIRHVHAAGPYFVRSAWTNWPAHTRYATGTEHLNNGLPLRLDWPAKDQSSPPAQTENDTSEEDVKSESWIPAFDTSPLGYEVDPINRERAFKTENRYTAGLVKIEGNSSPTNEERAGVHGYIYDQKLRTRLDRISTGIAAELRFRPREGRQAAILDRVKDRLLQDARAIWWQERQFMSPNSEFLHKQAEKRKALREARAQQSLGYSEVEPISEDAVLGETESTPISTEPLTNVSDSIADLVAQVRQTSLQNQYAKPHRRLAKKIAHDTRFGPNNIGQIQQQTGQPSAV